MSDLAQMYVGIIFGVALLVFLIVKSSWQGRISIAYLTFPFWGTVLIVSLAKLLNSCEVLSDNFVIVLGVPLLILSAKPIFTYKMLDPLPLRVLLAIAYWVVSLVVVFIVGWGSICTICGGC